MASSKAENADDNASIEAGASKEEKKRLKKERKKLKKSQKKRKQESDDDSEQEQQGGEPTAEETAKPMESSSDSDSDAKAKKKKDKKKDKKKKSKQKKEKKEKKDKKRRKRSESTSTDHSESEAEEPTEKRPRTDSTTTSSSNKTADHGDPRIVESSALESEPDPTKAGPVTLVLFYQYVEPIWSLEKYQKVLKYMGSLGRKLGLTGRMRVAREGLNCTLTCSREKIVEFCLTLRQQPEFQTTEFKLTNDLPEPQRFPHLKVIEVIELVHYGLEGEKAPPILDYKGVHLEPRDYHKKIAESNTVMIDVRNHYEAIIGHFQPPTTEENKAKGEGPVWLDPNMRKSTEFPVWLDKPETKEKLKGKQVLMYVEYCISLFSRCFIMLHDVMLFLFSLDISVVLCEGIVQVAFAASEQLHCSSTRWRMTPKLKTWEFKKFISCRVVLTSTLRNFQTEDTGKERIT